MNNDKLKHLEFIQNVINRMGYNSFLVKGWCITILAAFLAITANTGENRFVLLSFFPLICFWLLDSYYLQQERKFRVLYDDACKEDFPVFCMTPYDESIIAHNCKLNYWAVFFSKTMLMIYLPLSVMIAFLFLFLL